MQEFGTRLRRYGPLLFVPLSLLLGHLSLVPSPWVFVSGLVAIGMLADLVRRGTEQVSFARAGKMDIVIGICLGSAVQIAMVVAPVLVLVSWLIGHPMNLVFGSPLELFAIVSSVFIVRFIVADGETTWYEGFLLIGVYVLFALAFFFLGHA